MTAQQIVNKLIDTLESAVNDFNSSIPGIQRQIADEAERLLKELDIKGDTIVSNVANLKKIGAFKNRIYNIIQNSDYSDRVNEFMKTFTTVADLQNEYFGTVSEKFKPAPLLEEIKLQSILNTTESLTEAGLDANLVNPVHDLLLKNATSGGSVLELSKQLRGFLVNDSAGDGALARYAKLVTTDSLNQYAGQYMDAVANDLNLDWYMYVGSLLTTSRPWCEACVKKKYIHRSEFTRLIEGDFPEFEQEGGVIYDKTGLPSGMIDGTNANNLTIYRGGYNCGHQFIPVSSTVVPDSVKETLNA